jgi:2-oxoglutarate ferredoxin oxidoreductase subunit beta
LGLLPHNLLVVSGIGCSSNLPGYINAYGMHTLHGRSLAVATGAKLANHELNVIVTGGDGDGYGIGGNHFTHTARRNVDLTYIVMNNQIYGLTTGQISPTSRDGMKTKSTPFGSVEMPVNPITSAIMNGATFVARGYSGDVRHLTELMKQAIQHKGFALVDVFSPCVTFNHDNGHPFFKDRVKKLEDEGHDPSDWKLACEKAMMWGDTIYTGLFFQLQGGASLGQREPVLDQGGPLARRPLGLGQEEARRLIQRMM